MMSIMSITAIVSNYKQQSVLVSRKSPPLTSVTLMCVAHRSSRVLKVTSLLAMPCLWRVSSDSWTSFRVPCVQQTARRASYGNREKERKRGKQEGKRGEKRLRKKEKVKKSER